jgi:hypothetical protein
VKLTREQIQAAVARLKLSEPEPILQAYLDSIARRAEVSEGYAQYQLARYLQEKEQPSGDWHWRWWAEVDAHGGDAVAAFRARWEVTYRAHPHAADWLWRLLPLGDALPIWAAEQLDLVWRGVIPK